MRIALLLAVVVNVLASDMPTSCPFVSPRKVEQYIADVGEILREQELTATELGEMLEAIGKSNLDAPLLTRTKSIPYDEVEMKKLVICSGDECMDQPTLLDDLVAINNNPGFRSGALDLILTSVPFKAVDGIDVERALEANFTHPHHHALKPRLHAQHPKAVQLEEDDDEQPINIALGAFSMSRQLGAGGFKTVYLGKHAGADVAVAVITNRDGNTYLTGDELIMITNEIAVQEKIRETEINRREICREFILAIRAVHEKKDRTGTKAYYIIMDLAEGGDLENKPYNQELVALGAGLQMAAGLKCVHTAQYVHKDVKPMNYLKSKNGKKIYTHDFGLAKKFTSPNLGTLWGTPDFMPGRIHVGETAAVSLGHYDVFALGISFRELGIAAFMGKTEADKMLISMSAGRSSIDDVITTLANKALEHVDKKITSIEKKLTAAQKTVRDAAKKVSTTSTTLRTYERQMAVFDAENIFEKIARCCTSRSGPEDVESKITECQANMKSALQAKADAETEIAAANKQLDEVRVARAELLERLTLVRTPTEPYDKLMSNKKLV
jgi:serine/threonine protein kinase